MLPFQAREDLEAMAMKRYSASPKTQVLMESHHWIVYCHILETLWESFIPLQRCRRCILQPQLTGPLKSVFGHHIDK